MFVQVVRGAAGDPSAMRERFDTWAEKVKPGAEGFMGSTSGITPDGQFIVLARFESEEAARRNSQRPEQGACWSETEAVLGGPASFADSTDVDLLMGGGSDGAGFVQVMVGRSTDVQRARELNRDLESHLGELRPEVLGGAVAWLTGGTYYSSIYFTSEEAAREGEKQEMPADVAAILGELAEVAPVQEYLDIPDPWMH